MSWRCDICETVNGDTEKICKVCGAASAVKLRLEPAADPTPMRKPPAAPYDWGDIKAASRKSKTKASILVLILTVITLAVIYIAIYRPFAVIPRSKSEFVAACETMPDYETVLGNPADFKNALVKLNLSVDQVFSDGNYVCTQDASGDLVYDGNEYYVADRRGIGTSVLQENDTFIAYCIISGTKKLEKQATGEQVTFVKLNLKYADPAPKATPSPRITSTPIVTPTPTATPWPTETLDIDGEIVTAYIVDLRYYEWDQFSEWSDSQVEVTKNVMSYPKLLKGSIENCYGIKIRRFSAEAKKGNPFDVPFKGVLRLRNGKWSSGEEYNTFDYTEGTEVDVYILFMEATSFSAVDIIPTKAPDGNFEWSSTYYSPVLYFASIEDATRYIDSIR